MIVSQVNVLDVNSIWLKNIREDYEVLVLDSTVEVLLLISMYDEIDRLLVIHSFLEISDEVLMWLNPSAFTGFIVLLKNSFFAQLLERVLLLIRSLFLITHV